MFRCSDLMEETGRDPGLILGLCEFFGIVRTRSSFGKNFTHLTKLLRICHISKSLKNETNAYISLPIRR